eukprot:m.62114 g.62114  ORF g.62114 m.62114 type:complete len:98 (-) comp13918_c0_seq1:827-1120(-)
MKLRMLFLNPTCNKCHGRLIPGFEAEVCINSSKIERLLMSFNLFLLVTTDWQLHGIHQPNHGHEMIACMPGCNCFRKIALISWSDTAESLPHAYARQ